MDISQQAVKRHSRCGSTAESPFISDPTAVCQRESDASEAWPVLLETLCFFLPKRKRGLTLQSCGLRKHWWSALSAKCTTTTTDKKGQKRTKKDVLDEEKRKETTKTQTPKDITKGFYKLGRKWKYILIIWLGKKFTWNPCGQSCCGKWYVNVDILYSW